MTKFLTVSKVNGPHINVLTVSRILWVPCRHTYSI